MVGRLHDAAPGSSTQRAGIWRHCALGRLHDTCVEKHSGLPNPAGRKYKGRVVFGGHNITQEDGLQVVFQDGGSPASFMTAAKALDGVALLPDSLHDDLSVPLHLLGGMPKSVAVLPDGLQHDLSVAYDIIYYYIL